jgi:flagellar hook-length control protein FliK
MAVMRPAGGEPEDLEGSHNVLIMEPTSQRVEAPNGERTIPCPREESPGDAPAGVEQSVERKQDPQVREAPAPEVKKERVHVSDLARHLLEKIGEYQKNPTVHLRLEPPGLGEVVVRITLENSRLNIHFNASTVLAGALIEESLPVLTQSCLEKGLALGSLDISSQLFNSQGQGSLYPDRGGARPPLEEAETAPAEIAVLDGAKSRKLNVIV